MVPRNGFEPSTVRVWTVCSSQLSYLGIMETDSRAIVLYLRRLSAGRRSRRWWWRDPWTCWRLPAGRSARSWECRRWCCADRRAAPQIPFEETQSSFSALQFSVSSCSHDEQADKPPKRPKLRRIFCIRGIVRSKILKKPHYKHHDNRTLHAQL